MSLVFFTNVPCLAFFGGQGKKRWPVPFSARVAALIDTVVTFEGPNMWLDENESSTRPRAKSQWTWGYVMVIYV